MKEPKFKLGEEVVVCKIINSGVNYVIRIAKVAGYDGFMEDGKSELEYTLELGGSIDWKSFKESNLFKTFKDAKAQIERYKKLGEEKSKIEEEQNKLK